MNCGYGKGLSVLEVLDAVDRHTNSPVKRVMEGRRAGDPPELVAANERLLETLDWRPAYADIDRIVADALGVGAQAARNLLEPLFTRRRLTCRHAANSTFSSSFRWS